MERTNRILRKIMMCYVIFCIPTAIVFLGLKFLTDLRGKQLYGSLLPPAAVFFAVYILYLLRPYVVTRFWGAQSSGDDMDRNNS